MEAEEKEESGSEKKSLFQLYELQVKPPYTQDITKLRKDGKLADALELSIKALLDEPDNIWNKRAASWVHFDYLKKNSGAGDFDSFKEHLNKIKELQLPEDEKMLFDQCAWKIGSMVFAIQHQTPVDFQKINALFDIINEFHFTKPSQAYSFIYKAFHKGHEHWTRYCEFADWWDFENFLSEDFLEEEYQGKRIMALVEQGYIAYSKKLLEGIPLDGFGTEYEIDNDKIQNFLPEIDALIESHPDYQYPPYFKAKMLIALGGNTEEILTAFLPFAKKNKNVFWVWELMAEIFSNQDDLQFACYCKALKLKTPETFLVKLRQQFAAILISKKMYVEAKTEIERAIATRKENGWRLTGQLTQWTEQDWYRSTQANADNSVMYAAHLQQAEDVLLADIPEVTVAVEFVNRNKSIINFVKDKTIYGFFKYDKEVLNPKIGDLLKVRFGEASSNGFYKVFTAKSVEEGTTCEAIKTFEGSLKIIPPHNFGFADEVFIDPEIIESNSLKDGQKVKGKAILSFNKKKDEWGWKGIEIYPLKNKTEK